VDLRDEFSQQIFEQDKLAGIGGLLGWDQQVFMPSGSAAGRVRQSELIGRLYHERSTSPRLGAFIEAVASFPNLSLE